MEPSVILQKIYKYCAFQERSRREVEQKLRALGAPPEDIPDVLALLEAEDFLNEARFAEVFAHGRFHMKHWGRRKIAQALHQKGINRPMIEQALVKIDTTAYQKALHDLAEKKWHELHREAPQKRREKTYRYLLQKGYEPDLIYASLRELAES